MFGFDISHKTQDRQNRHCVFIPCIRSLCFVYVCACVVCSLPLYLRYNETLDVLEVVEGNTDPTMAANASRLGTFIRPGGEQVHTFKQEYDILGNRVHNSRLVAVGQRTLDYYNNLHGRNYGREWAETPKIQIEYLVVAGRYNQNHPKFFR